MPMEALEVPETKLKVEEGFGNLVEVCLVCGVEHPLGELTPRQCIA